MRNRIIVRSDIKTVTTLLKAIAYFNPGITLEMFYKNTSHLTEQQFAYYCAMLLREYTQIRSL